MIFLAGSFEELAGRCYVPTQFPINYFVYKREISGNNFDAVIHAAMEIYGVSERWRRNPYMNASNDQMDEIKKFLKGLKLL